MAEVKEESDDIYDEEVVEKLSEEDEMHPEEAGFMEGYDEGDAVIKCANCGKLIDLDAAFEEKIGKKTHRFCSVNCSESFERSSCLFQVSN